MSDHDSVVVVDDVSVYHTFQQPARLVGLTPPQGVSSLDQSPISMRSLPE
jgi:hypothetical protein